MREKQKIKIVTRRLQNLMTSLRIRTYTELAAELYREGLIEDVSVQSILRWNREGWPEFKFARLCEHLGCSADELRAAD